MRKFKKYQSIGLSERKAVSKVMNTGILSGYVADNSPNFYGGPLVKKFERMCEKYFKVKHAITVNSWSSGLTAAIGSIRINPGDEVIVSPWTMCASATAILHWNAIPVFADIDKDTFCLDPNSVEKLINSKTKAIMTVDIFGQSSDIDALKKIAKKRKLILISDSAQAPGATYKGKYAGTIADIGGYSLNYHKHIHTGEGGILFTNNDKFAKRMRMIRNHAEVIVSKNNKTDLINMIGYNFRLGEIEAAIGIEQLKKLKVLLRSRQLAAKKLINGLKNLNGLKTPIIKEYNTHVFYVLPLVLSSKIIKIKRNKIIQFLKKRGVPGLMEGYSNLHLLPMYQNKIAYGKSGFPWSISKRKISYKKGICPIAEELHEKYFFGIEICMYKLENKDTNFIIRAFHKVWKDLKI